MNTDAYGMLIARAAFPFGTSIFGILLTIVLVLVTLSLLVKITKACFRRGGFIPFVLVIIFSVWMYSALSEAHKQSKREGKTSVVSSQVRPGMVQSDQILLTLRGAKDIPDAVSGVDLALTLKQLAHNLALTDMDQKRPAWLSLPVKRTDEGTIRLGDVVRSREVRRHHEGRHQEDIIDLTMEGRGADANLFRETAAALQERVAQEETPTLALEINDQRLRIRVAHDQEYPAPVERPIELASQEYEQAQENAAEAIEEALSEADLDFEDVEEIISSAINGIYEGLAEAKRAHAKTTDQDKSEPDEEVAEHEVVVEQPSEIEEEEADTSEKQEVAENEDATVESTEVASVSTGIPMSTESLASQQPAVTFRPHPPQGLSEQGDYHVTIHAGPHKNLSDCNAELDEKRLAALGDYADKLLGSDASERLDLEQFLFIYKIPENPRTEMTEDPQFGQMYNIHSDLSFDRSIQQHLRSEYHDAVIGDRLKVTGVASASVLLLLSAVFGYLKLDNASRGYYRGRLIAGVVGFSFIVAVAAALAIGG